MRRLRSRGQQRGAKLLVVDQVDLAAQPEHHGRIANGHVGCRGHVGSHRRAATGGAPDDWLAGRWSFGRRVWPGPGDWESLRAIFRPHRRISPRLFVTLTSVSGLTVLVVDDE